ncbi:MAG: hypothetical protein U0575_09330 [Phycisphaerales bacterium]
MKTFPLDGYGADQMMLYELFGDPTMELRLEPAPADTPKVCCPGDLDGDGVVGGFDLALMVLEWLKPTPCDMKADLTGDGKVNGDDLGKLLKAWGPCM